MNQGNSAVLTALAKRLSMCATPSRAFGHLELYEEELVDALIAEFRLAAPEARLKVTRTLTPGACAVLLEYAREAAIKAVNEHAPARIDDGLCALAIDSGGQDPRDTIVVLTVLHRSAELLGIDSVEQFERASRLFADGPLMAEVRGFPARPKEDRSPAGFQISEKVTPDGFTYEQGSWNFKPQIRQARTANLIRRLRARWLL